MTAATPRALRAQITALTAALTIERMAAASARLVVAQLEARLDAIADLAHDALGAAGALRPPASGSRVTPLDAQERPLRELTVQTPGRRR